MVDVDLTELDVAQLALLAERGEAEAQTELGGGTHRTSAWRDHRVALAWFSPIR